MQFIFNVICEHTKNILRKTVFSLKLFSDKIILHIYLRFRRPKFTVFIQCPCKHFWHYNKQFKNYSCDVCSKSTTIDSKARVAKLEELSQEVFSSSFMSILIQYKKNINIWSFSTFITFFKSDLISFTDDTVWTWTNTCRTLYLQALTQVKDCYSRFPNL